MSAEEFQIGHLELKRYAEKPRSRSAQSHMVKFKVSYCSLSHSIIRYLMLLKEKYW